MLRGLAALIATLAITTPAQAATTIDGPDRYQAWINQALTPTPNTDIRVHTEPCPQALGNGASWCMNPQTLDVWTDADFEYLWAEDSSDRDKRIVQLTFLHELGHVYDYSAGPKDYRRHFTRIMRYPDPKRWPLTWQSERLASAYAYCALYNHYQDVPAFDLDSYQPTEDQYERICYVLRRRPVASPHAR